MTAKQRDAYFLDLTGVKRGIFYLTLSLLFHEIVSHSLSSFFYFLKTDEIVKRATSYYIYGNVSDFINAIQARRVSI
jgi:hypothetical protein